MSKNKCCSSKVNPLVSVVVITYNSSATVVETLDSIKDQTYQNIELIISDDRSTDNTVQVCEEWLKENSGRFVHSEIVTTEVNTGVSGNLNRGIKASCGEWIKSIAGDDLLIPTAIEEYVKFIYEHTEDVKMCVSDVEPFSTNGPVPLSVKDAWKKFFQYSQESYIQQYRRVLRQLVFVGPTYFYRRELYNEVDGFSEEYGNAEEWPFVYKVLKRGDRIYAINKKLIYYRVSNTSLCHSQENGLGNYRLFLSTYKFFFDYPFKDLLRKHHYFIAWDLFLSYKVRKLRYMTHNSKWVDVVQKMVQLVNPYAYMRKMGLRIGI